MNGLTLSNLTLTYQRHPAVHHLSGHFPAGSLTAIMGPNGGGKSTLLKALAGLHPIDEGTLYRSPQHELKDTAYLPQNLTWDREFPLTVEELAAQALIKERRFWKGFSKEQKEQIHQALEKVNLWNQRHQPIGSLSLGQFQRALFARVILQKANVILLDEPLSGLDEQSCEDFFKQIQQWQHEGKTLIAVLHDRSTVLKYFETTLVLCKEALAWGPSQQVLNSVSWPLSASMNTTSPSFSEEVCRR